MQQHLEKMLAEVAGTGAAPPPGNLQADRFTPTGTFSLLCQVLRCGRSFFASSLSWPFVASSSILIRCGPRQGSEEVRREW
jgi:hypothetical protein